MKTVLKLLKKELREWKKQDADNKYYYKGEEDHPWAKAAFKDCKKHIAELEKSIAILKTHDVKPFTLTRSYCPCCGIWKRNSEAVCPKCGFDEEKDLQSCYVCHKDWTKKEMIEQRCNKRYCGFNRI